LIGVETGEGIRSEGVGGAGCEYADEGAGGAAIRKPEAEREATIAAMAERDIRLMEKLFRLAQANEAKLSSEKMIAAIPQGEKIPLNVLQEIWKRLRL